MIAAVTRPCAASPPCAMCPAAQTFEKSVPTGGPTDRACRCEVAEQHAMLSVAAAHSEAMRMIRSRLSHSPVTRLLTPSPLRRQSGNPCAQT